MVQYFSPLSVEQKDDGKLVEERVDELIEIGAEIFGRRPRKGWRRVMVTRIRAVAPFTDQSLPERPRIRVPRYRGLFMVGDGVRIRGLGGDLAARSATTGPRRILEYLALTAV